jgi:hypothetical protein
MALVFRIENNDASDTYNLLSAGGELKLVRSSFSPQAGADGLVTEAFEVIDNDTLANMRTSDNDLETILEKARRWHRMKSEYESIWLRWHTDGETAKRALIYDYAKRHQPSLTDDPLMELSTIRESLAITRHPYFESVTAATSSTTGISTLGGTWDLSGTISGGTIDGRINRFTMGAGAGDEIKRLWLGITDSPHIAGSYDPVAECGDGNVIDADTSIVSTTMETDFVDETLKYRFSVRLGDFADPQELVGRHLVLLRCQNDSGTASAVRLSTSWFVSPSASDSRQVQSIVYVTNTDYRMIELGEIEIPGSSWRQEVDDLTPDLQYWSLNFEIQRTSGSGKFIADAVVLIPSEHLLTWTDAVFRPSNTETAEIFTYEDDEVAGFTRMTTPSRFIESASVGARNWSYPINGGIVVIAAQDQNGHDRTATVQPGIEVFKRWLTYHG